MTDAAFLLEILSDGEEHSLTEILQASFAQRGCGLTVHSRASDLRAQGHVVVCERIASTTPGRVSSTYQLIPLRESEGNDRLGPAGSSDSQSESGGTDQATGSASPPKQPLSLDSSEDEQLAFEVAA